ncbi:MAG: hypothetical protein ACO2OX_02720 [Candidatus Nanopusillus sp.]
MYINNPYNVIIDNSNINGQIFGAYLDGTAINNTIKNSNIIYNIFGIRINNGNNNIIINIQYTIKHIWNIFNIIRK